MSKSTTTVYHRSIEIDLGEGVSNAIFTANDENLVSSSDGGVKVWRVKDGKHLATIPVEGDRATKVAVSNDGRWIAAGTSGGCVLVWDAETYEQVIADRIGSDPTHQVNFSPDSASLVSADGPNTNKTATIWDVVARRKVRTLEHSDAERVCEAKYSPQGDRIATTTEKSIQIWDSNDGRLLVKTVRESYPEVLWSGDHCLFVAFGSRTIQQIDAATGSTVSSWRVPTSNPSPGVRIALLRGGKLIAYSALASIAFWDTTTHIQLSPIQHVYYIYSAAYSSDGLLLAIAGAQKITIKALLRLVLEPELDIDGAALDAWKLGQLTNSETLLSETIPTSKNKHQALASRALVRARLGQWDAALVDAKESLNIQRSDIGHIAMCVALVSSGEKDKGIRLCDVAFQHFQKHVTLFLLIKAVVLFMAGEDVDAISRLDDLITDVWIYPALYVVQAYMHLVLGNKRMESGDYESAIQSFEDARTGLDNPTLQPPLIVSLISGWSFDGLAITVQQRLCEALLAAGRTKEAGESLLRMVDEEVNMSESIETWTSDFKNRCSSKVEQHGDSALDAKQYDTAVSQYTVALSLDPASRLHLLVKRSKAYAGKGGWEDALSDAHEVIELDSSSPSGYERKYAALLGMGRLDDATAAFDTMLLKMSESSDPDIQERSHRYVRPEQIKKEIRTSIKNTTLNLPMVLINTLSGRLCNKSEQAAAFELMPIFTTLITSMTTHIDHSVIEQVVGEFYRYVTLSHTWEGDEPLYEKVVKTVVYDLEALPTHEKLRMFCKVVQDEGFVWAWSDTCCIDKGDHFVLQEALVSMFKWYEWSALTIIFLCDVDQLAELGALMRSLWNSRGWTLQEYHASKVIRIYTKDWTPYLGLTIYNYKESPEIISEMEQATGISAQALMALRPGLNDVREKLRLASTRQTTRVEDAAYSLLGIFSMTLPVTYGEGDKALGRLLSQLLMTSGDTSILAWTGRSGSFNSCLPTEIIVFSQPSTLHIPAAIPDAEMGTIIAELHTSLLDLTLATRLYDRVDELRTPTFAGQRMRLPCLAFKITTISPFRKGSEVVFRARAGALGVVEITTRQNLALLDSLYLIHPWIDFLLDRHAAGNMVRRTPVKDQHSEPEEFLSLESLPDISDQALDATSLPSPSTTLSMDAQMHVYKFLARLRQPFGALLLASNPWNVTEYRRIVGDSLIRVQVKEITPATLEWMIQGVQVLDVL